MPGGYPLLKNKTWMNMKRKSLNRKEREKSAYDRVLLKMADTERQELLDTWEETKLTGDKEKADSIILTLMARNFSRIEIRALLGVGESRLHRLSRDPADEEAMNGMEEISIVEPQTVNGTPDAMNEIKSETIDGNPQTMYGISQTRKRQDYLEWSDYFMAIAFLSAQRSKDPRTQVGACIVNPENKIVGIGYNGMPNGCHDDLMPWGNDSDDVLDCKSLYVCHAELNAVLNKNSSDVKGCRLYVALFPCNECAKIIIQSGIAEVIYYSDKYADQPKYMASKRMFDLASVSYWQYQPKYKQIVIDFDSINLTHQSTSFVTPKAEPFAEGYSDFEITYNDQP